MCCHCARHHQRYPDGCEIRNHRQRLQEQRSDDANTGSQFEDADELYLPWLKFMRPTWGGQSDESGVGREKSERSGSPGEEGKDDLNDLNCGIHWFTFLKKTDLSKESLSQLPLLP